MNLIEKIQKISKKITYLPHQEELARIMQEQDGLIAHHGLGSGKTLTAINAANSLGIPATAVVPASLRENFKKEIHKANPNVPFDVMSYESFTKNRPDLTGRMLILDEAHRIKNEGSARSQAVSELAMKAKKRLLLTGTPIQNKPHDIAMLMNVAAGRDIMPTGETEFNKRYLKKINPGFFGRLRGEKTKYELNNSDEYNTAMNKYVDSYMPARSLETFPDVSTKIVPVSMSPDQYEQYKGFERGAGGDVRDIIADGGSGSGKNMARLNSFLNKTRQISNVDTRGNISPKLQSVIDNVESSRGPNLIYSNFIDSGINPLAEALKSKGKRVGTFTGTMNDNQKKEMVDNYNKGMMDALLISSAGAEGLDLKGTSRVHIVEPHWNDPKIDQVVGRSARMHSHSHLPENQRNVEVMKYISKRPGSFFDRFYNRPPTTDEYLQELSRKKEDMNRIFLNR